MMRAFAAMIFALAVAVLPAGAATAGADSTQRAVAAFIASNFKLAMAQAMGDLTSQGLTLDSAAVMDMVRADLATPYDRAEHTAAYDAVMLAVANARAGVNDAFIAEA